MNYQLSDIERLKQELQKERKARRKAENKYAELIKLRHENPNPIIRFNASGEMLSANGASLSIVNSYMNEEEDSLLEKLAIQAKESATTQQRIRTEREHRGKHYTCCSVPFSKEAYVNLYLTDISDRSYVEESLQQNQNLVQKILDTLPLLLYVYDLVQTRNVYTNQPRGSLFGYSSTELEDMGSNLFTNIIHPEDLALYAAHHAALAEAGEGEVREIQYRTRHKNGKWKWIRSREISFKRSSDGKLIQVLGTAEDITETKQIELRLKEQQAFYETILANLPADIAVFDKDYQYVYANPLAFKDSSLRAWIIGKTDYEYCAYRGKSRELADVRKKVLDQVKEERKNQEWEERFVSPEGHEIFISRRVAPVYDEQGNLVYIIGSGTDITTKKKALNELQEQKEFIRQVIDTAPSLVYVKDRNGRFTLVNQAMADLLPPDFEITNERNMLIKTPNPEENESFARDDRHVIDTREELVKEEEFTKPSGEKIWMQTIKRPIHRMDGSVQVLGISTDITEVKRAKEELRQREELYRLLSENSRDIICLHNLSGNYTFVSNSLKEVLGYEPEDLLRQSPYRFIHPDDALRVEQQHKKAFTQIITDIGTFRFRNKNGEYVWLETIVKAIPDENGNVIRLQSSSRDVTERKESEEKILQSEKRYRDLVNYSQAIICTLDLEGKIGCVNPYMQKILGYEEDEVLLQHLRDYIPISHHAGFDAFLASFAYDNEKNGIICIMNKEGKRKYLLSHAYKVDEPGNEPHIIAYAQDITDRLLAESELQKAKIAAEESAVAKENFLANMSHEIRTPMNGVIGMMRLLAKTDLNEQQNYYLKNIRTSAENLLVIINDILDMAKIDSGKLELERIPFNISDTIHAVYQSQLYRAEEKDVLLLMTPVPVANPMMIGDPYRLNQVLLNLLSNAIKFTHQGSIQLSSRVLEEDEEALILEFTVQDTGIGIPQDKQETIFEGFTQAYTSTTRKYGGTGLGLAICKSLVERQGGRIWVESTENEGSKFKFTLPLQKSQEAVPASGQLQEVDYQSLGKVRVLLTEDNEINQFLAQTILTGWGFAVDTAINGQEALDLFEEHDYDIVLMDIQMPVMSGLEATQHIRRHPNPFKAGVPIIALTANALKGDDEKYIAAGMTGYLSKPFEEEKLFQKISMNLKAGSPMSLSPSHTPAAPAAPLAEHRLFDLSQLRKICAGDLAFIRKMLQLFLEVVPVYLHEMKSRQEECNWQAIGAIAHKLKPNMDTMGILILKEEIRMLEEYGKNETHLLEIPPLIDKLDMVLNEVLEKVKEEIVLHQGKAPV